MSLFISYTPKAPVTTSYVTGSGTHTPQAGCILMIVQAVGAGGAGAANGSGPSNGTSGGNTTFGSVTCGGGGFAAAGGQNGGAGGTNTTAYTNILNIAGQAGLPGGYDIDEPGASGGSTLLGPGGNGGARGAGGTTPGLGPAGYGGGGGGGGGNGTYASGGGGGSGAYQLFSIANPSTSGYSYSIGSGGTLGGAHRRIAPDRTHRDCWRICP